VISLELPIPTDRISAHDEMFEGNLDHYMRVGESAMQSILAALRAAGRDRCDAILDLPSGHGRVLRWLRAKFPEARITACDLNREGVDWCAERFGARPVYSVPDIRGLQVEEVYDLIWCGSLLTHLDWSHWGTFLNFFSTHMTPGGVLIFTTQGRLSAEWLHTGRVDYGLKPDVIAGIVEDYRRCGFGYRNYWHSKEYGISIAAPWRVMDLLQSLPEMRVVGYAEAAWDQHQDVVACARRAQPLVEYVCAPASSSLTAQAGT
jgi:hypothetical protein